MHDFGFFQYETFLNYMDHSKKSNEDLFQDHDYLKPVFRNR